MSKSKDEKYIISGPPNKLKPRESSFGEYIFNRLKLAGDGKAMINGLTDQSMTHRELLQKSVNLATSLRELGFKKGDVLTISSENRFEFTITALAVIYIGGVVTTLNVTYTKEEVRHALTLTKPRFAVCSPLTAINVKQYADELGYIEQYIVYGDQQIINAHMFNKLAHKNVDVDTFKFAKLDSVNDVLVILCSSGTSGMPKGVMLTHNNFLHTTGQVEWMMSYHRHIRGETRLLTLVPWFHAYGFITTLVYLSLEYKIIFLTKFEENLFLKIIQDYKINIAFTVPPVILFLAKHPLVDKYDLSSLNELVCGAAPLSKELQEATIKRLNLKSLSQGYGLTECTLICIYDTSLGRKNGSSGSIITGLQIKVIDVDSGEALGPYKEGEICIKGDSIMKGYVGQRTATSATVDEDGWLRTGDICYYDDDRYFYIIDRLKELIKYKGFQVPPAELEAILLQHKEIKDAAVIGLPSEEAGELPLAYVVTAPNSTVTEKELIDFVADKVSPAKRLRGGVRFIESIPKNASGKVLRRFLRDRLKLETSSKL